MMLETSMQLPHCRAPLQLDQQKIDACTHTLDHGPIDG
jgi:hypothetical protein